MEINYKFLHLEFAGTRVLVQKYFFSFNFGYTCIFFYFYIHVVHMYTYIRYMT
jgi:hypothetical protein